MAASSKHARRGLWTATLFVLTAGIPAARGDDPDDGALAASGIRKLESAHLVLYTDVREPAADALPRVFDLAVPQWADYFGVPETKTASWRMIACVMRDAEPFRRLGLLPDDLPPFLTGYQRGERLWMHEQPSDYYRRHLLLHEGTHGFTVNLLGGGGPPWYMEGIAEYLGLHRWQDGRLELAYNARESAEVAYWGRVKILKREYEAGRGMTLRDVMTYDAKAHRRLEPYAWCWAAAMLLDHHPASRAAFREFRNALSESPDAFSARLYGRLESRWPELELNWQALIAAVEYGYDVERAAIVLREGVARGPGGSTMEVDASRGWHDSGIELDAGSVYRATATGRVVLRGEPRWEAEPNGITLHYYRGKPLGMLLAAVVPNSDPARIGVPIEIGLHADLRPNVSGRLYWKINESAADLADNEGRYSVRIQ
ncbi:MAG: hypothetical protein FJ297_11700 [Planctomycetes bacterium]|nr:hypothetical protein [Planctomycetota bacterium]